MLGESSFVRESRFGRAFASLGIAEFIFVVSISIYLFALIWLGRLPQPDTDEIFYKSPGREWAASGRFASPEFRGWYGFDPPLERIWLVYPPVYPFLFGVFVKVFGFGWRQCEIFDGLIRVAVAALTYAVAYRLADRHRSWAALCAGLAILPMSVWVIGRPDDLAVCFGMLGLLPLLASSADAVEGPPSPRAILVSGALLGLCAATSPVASIVIGLIGAVQLALRCRRPSQFVGAGALWVAAGALALGAAVAPVLWQVPAAYKQFQGHAGAIRSDTRSLGERLRAILTVGRLISIPVLGLILVGQGLFLRARDGRTAGRWARSWLGPVLGIVFLLAIKVHSPAYIWYMGPFVVAAVMAGLVSSWPAGSLARGLPWALAVLLLVGYGSLEYGKQALLYALMPGSQRLDPNVAVLRRLIPHGSTIVTYEFWWVIGNEYDVRDRQIPPWLWGEIDYVVATTSTPLGLQDLYPLDDYVRAHFVPCYDGRSEAPITFLGSPISRTFHGYGPLIWKRRTADRASTVEATVIRR